METVNIKPSHPSQGDFVVINKDDFNPELHEIFSTKITGDLTKNIAQKTNQPKQNEAK